MNAQESALLEGCMTKIEELTAEINAQSDNHSRLLDLKKTAEWIADLSMIHGFEGVQNISEKLCHSIEHSLYRNQPITPSLLSKVRQAIEAMREVANLELSIESNLTVESVTERAELDRIKVFDRTREFSESIVRAEESHEDAVDVPEQAESADEVEVSDEVDVADRVDVVSKVDEASKEGDEEEAANAPHEVNVVGDDNIPNLMFDIAEVTSVMDLIEDPDVLLPETEALKPFVSDS